MHFYYIVSNKLLYIIYYNVYKVHLYICNAISNYKHWGIKNIFYYAYSIRKFKGYLNKLPFYLFSLHYKKLLSKSIYYPYTIHSHNEIHFTLVPKITKPLQPPQLIKKSILQEVYK